MPTEYAYSRVRPDYPGDRHRDDLAAWAAVAGVGRPQMVLLGLTAAVGTLTIVPGRANVLQGGIHLSLAAVFLFLAASP